MNLFVLVLFLLFLFSFYGIFGFLNDYDGVCVNYIVFDFGQ